MSEESSKEIGDETSPPESEISKKTLVPTSPVTSLGNKVSSCGASMSSKTPGQPVGSHPESSKVAYVNEKRLQRDHLLKSSYSNRPRNIQKEAPDVKHMEKALLDLLHDFHTGKLTAFGQGCSMEQMISIRDQQEHLSRLHFKLGSKVEIPQGNETSSARDKMKQLVQSLEQLSVSIENLHSGDTSSI